MRKAQDRGDRGLRVQPFVDEALGNSAHLVYVSDAGVAALVDPERDVDAYLEQAEALGVTIEYVLETHLHNDFVSGAREVAHRTGATVGASADATLEYEHRALRDGDRLPLGTTALEVIATPGHTPEHIAFGIRPEGAEATEGVFTGGALIVGGAARTDLLGHAMTQPLARRLYHTIYHRLMRMPDEVEVYPTHGAGSFCNVTASGERTTTIGQERAQNPLCQPQSEEDFVHLAVDGLSSYPIYFEHLRAVNRRGPRLLDNLPDLKLLSPREVKQAGEEGAAILDVRPARDFWSGHVLGAYGIPLGAPLTTWAGWLIPHGTQVILVVGDEASREGAIRRLLLIGYEDLMGVLDGGMAAWRKAGLSVETVETMAVDELAARRADGDHLTVLDVRQQSEWDAGHLPGAVHIENGRLPYDELSLPKDGPVVVHCGQHNRATAGLSVLKRRGYRNLILLNGGYSGWERAGFEVQKG